MRQGKGLLVLLGQHGAEVLGIHMHRYSREPLEQNDGAHRQDTHFDKQTRGPDINDCVDVARAGVPEVVPSLAAMAPVVFGNHNDS